MGLLGFLIYPWGLILQAIAIIHFIRRRPDTFWIFIITMNIFIIWVFINATSHMF